MMASKAGDYDPILPDMTLWQEIIFLTEYAECPFIIENVVPYYEPLIRPMIEMDRHYFWANFKIQKWEFDKEGRDHMRVRPTDKLYGYDLSKYDVPDKIKILRNMVNPKVGLHLFNCARGVYRNKNGNQQALF